MRFAVTVQATTIPVFPAWLLAPEDMGCFATTDPLE